MCADQLMCSDCGQGMWPVPQLCKDQPIIHCNHHEGNSRRKNTGHCPQTVRMHIRGVISISPDSCIFLSESTKIVNLKCLGFCVYVCVITF